MAPPPPGGSQPRVWEDFSVDDDPEDFPDPFAGRSNASVAGRSGASVAGRSGASQPRSDKVPRRSSRSSSTGYGGPNNARNELFGFRRPSLRGGSSLGSRSRSRSSSSSSSSEGGHSLVRSRNSGQRVIRRALSPNATNLALPVRSIVDSNDTKKPTTSGLDESRGPAPSPSRALSTSRAPSTQRSRLEVSFRMPESNQPLHRSSSRRSSSSSMMTSRSDGRYDPRPNSQDRRLSSSDYPSRDPRPPVPHQAGNRTVESPAPLPAPPPVAFPPARNMKGVATKRLSSLPAHWKVPEDGSFRGYLYRWKGHWHKQWSRDLFVVQHNVMLICTRESPFLVKHCIPLVNLQKIEHDERDETKFTITYLMPLKKGKSRAEVMQCKALDTQECRTWVTKLQQVQRKALLRGDPITDFVERDAAEQTLRSAYSLLHGTTSQVLANLLNKVHRNHERRLQRECYYKWRSIVQSQILQEGKIKVANVDKEVQRRTEDLSIQLRNQTLELKGERAFRLAADRINYVQRSLLLWVFGRLKRHADSLSTQSMALGAASLITYGWRQAVEIQAVDAATWRRRRINGIFMLMRQRRLRDGFDRLRVFSQLWGEVYKQRRHQLALLLRRKHEVGLAERRIILDRWRTFCDYQERCKKALLGCLRNERYRQSRALVRKWFLSVAKKCVYDMTAVVKMASALNSVKQRQLGWCFRSLASHADEKMNLETLQVAANFNMLNSKLVKSFNQVPLHRGVLVLDHALSNMRITRLRHAMVQWRFKSLRQKYCEKAASTMAAMCTAVHKRRALCEALFKWLNHSHRHRRREMALSAGCTKLTIFMKMKTTVDLTSAFSQWRKATVLDKLLKEKERLFARYGKVIHHGRMTAMDTFCHRLAFWVEKVERRTEMWVVNRLRSKMAGSEVLRQVARLHLLGRVIGLFDRLRMAKLAAAWQQFRMTVRDEDLRLRKNASCATAALEASQRLRQTIVNQNQLENTSRDLVLSGSNFLAPIPEESASLFSADGLAKFGGSSSVPSLSSRLQSDSVSSVSFLLSDHSGEPADNPLGVGALGNVRKRRRMGLEAKYVRHELVTGALSRADSRYRRKGRSRHLITTGTGAASTQMRRGVCELRSFKHRRRMPTKDEIARYKKRMMQKRTICTIERTGPRGPRLQLRRDSLFADPGSARRRPQSFTKARLNSHESDFHLQVKRAIHEADRYLMASEDASSEQNGSSTGESQVQGQFSNRKQPGTDGFGYLANSGQPAAALTIGEENAVAFVENDGPLMPQSLTAGNNAARQLERPALPLSLLHERLANLPARLLPSLEDDNMTISVSEIDDIMSQFAAAGAMAEIGQASHPAMQTGLAHWATTASNQASNGMRLNGRPSAHHEVLTAIDVLTRLIEKQGASSPRQRIMAKNKRQSGGAHQPPDYLHDRAQLSVDDWVDWNLLSEYLNNESFADGGISSEDFSSILNADSPTFLRSPYGLHTRGPVPQSSDPLSLKQKKHRSRRQNRLQDIAEKLIAASAKGKPSATSGEPAPEGAYRRSPIAPLQGLIPGSALMFAHPSGEAEASVPSLPISTPLSSRPPGSQQIAFRALPSRKHIPAV